VGKNIQGMKELQKMYL